MSSCIKKNKVNGVGVDSKLISKDVVTFDKEHYIKLRPFYGFFYGFMYDEYFIPPIEEHRKKTVTPTTRSFVEITKGIKRGNGNDNNRDKHIHRN